MPRHGVFGLVVLAGCALSRPGLALRRLKAAGVLGTCDSEHSVAYAHDGAAERQTAARRRWGWRRLHERIDEAFRDLVMQYMPVRYYWIALGRRNGSAAHLGVWEVAVSFRGDVSDHLQLVGDFMSCVPDGRSLSLDFSFVAFLPRGGEVVVGCEVTVNAVSLESWHILSGRPRHRFDDVHFHHYEYFPSRPLELDHLFSQLSPLREWFVGDTDDGIGLWNTTSWDMLWQHPRPGPYNTAFSPKGDTIALIELDWESGEEKLIIVAAASGRELCGAGLAHTRLAPRGGDRRLGYTGDWLTVCDPRGGTSVKFRVYWMHEHCRLVDTGFRKPCCDATGSGLILHRSASRMIVGRMACDAKQPILQTTFERPYGRSRQDCLGARFSPDGKHAIFRDRLRWFIWPFADVRPPRPIQRNMLFSDDGSLLVGLDDFGLKLIDTTSGAESDFTSERKAPHHIPPEYSWLLAVSSAQWRKSTPWK